MSDLEIMKQAVIEEKLLCFDRLKMLARMSANELKDAGYMGTPADAVLSCFKNSLKRVDELVKAYLKKYPD